MRFFSNVIFVTLLKATFVASVNLGRFQCNSVLADVPFLLQFISNRHQVARSFKQVRNHCDVAATNQTEIAASLHLRFSPIFIANSGSTKIALKSATKIASKLALVNGPQRGSVTGI